MKINFWSPELGPVSSKFDVILCRFDVAGPLRARAARSKMGASPRPPLNPPGVVSPDLKALGAKKSDHQKPAFFLFFFWGGGIFKI